MKPIHVGSSTGVSPFTPPTLSSGKGATAALTSVKALETAQAGEKDGGSFVKRAVVAALIGVTLLSSVAPAHADTTQVVGPQTSSLVMTHEATGPPGLVMNDALAGQQRFENFLGTQTLRGGAHVATDAASKAAFDTFTARLTQILHRDAASLAAGHRPVADGASLTAAQQAQVEGALGDLIKQMPVGAFGAGVENSLEGVFSLIGKDADLSQVRLGDLGRVGGDAAKDILKHLKQEHRGSYNTMLGVAAAGAVAIGYTQGTDALRSLGIRPEVSTTIFDGVKLKIGVDAGPRFSDPAVTVGVSGQTRFDSGTIVRGAIQTRIQGGQLGESRLEGSVTTMGGFHASGELRTDTTFKPLDVRLSATQQFDRWNVSGEARYNFQNDNFSSTISAGRTFDLYQKNDLDLQIRGSFDNQGNHQVGIGATLRF